jgi:hypothetical protein
MNPILVAGFATIVLAAAFWLIRDYDWQHDDERKPMRLVFANDSKEGEEGRERTG